MAGIATHHGGEEKISAASLFTGTALDALLKDTSIVSQPPYQLMQSRLVFDETSAFWWHVTASSLSKLMTEASYALPLHYKNLAFCYDAVLNGYGPTPSQNDTRTLKGTGDPSESVIRFTIEANSAETGSTADPLNQKSIESLIKRAAKAGTSFDLTIYDHLREDLFFSDEEAIRLRIENPDHFAPQSYFAFDFERVGEILAKGFFFFFWKSKATGRAPRLIAHDLISSIPVIGTSFAEALGAWSQCLANFSTKFGGEPRVECMGFDLLEPGETSRIKVYTRLVNSSFDAVIYLYTLGGMLKDPATFKGLELLKQFWHVVCGVEDGSDFGKQEVPCLHEGWADIIVNWEFKPGSKFPKPKFYMPLWRWLPDESVICERLSEYWRQVGWEKQASTYAQDRQEIFPWIDASGHGGTNYVSFAYKDNGTGLYMTLYLSAKAHDAARKLGVA